MVNLLQFETLLRCISRTAQPDNIQSANSVVPFTNRKRGQIFADTGAALHQCERSDASELMNHARSGNEDAISHDHMAAQQCTVREDVVVSDHAIVSYVTAGHEKVT